MFLFFILSYEQQNNLPSARKAENVGFSSFMRVILLGAFFARLSFYLHTQNIHLTYESL